jgi:hypothetical protein
MPHQERNLACLGLPDADPAQLGVYALDAEGDVNFSEVEPLLTGGNCLMDLKIRNRVVRQLQQQLQLIVGLREFNGSLGNPGLPGYSAPPSAIVLHDGVKR